MSKAEKAGTIQPIVETNRATARVLKEMTPYYVPLVATLLLITYVPAITTWLPTWALSK
mgnify:CR=1 FL=1